MTTALVVSNLLLWLAVVALSAVVVALLRQVGVLHERIAPAGALLTGKGPQVGEPAPRLTVEDWSGALHTLGGPDPEGKSTLLLFVSPTCPLCKEMLSIAVLVERAEQTWLRLLLASDGPRAEHETFVRERRLDRHGYLLSSQLGLAYQVGKLPYAVLIGADGIVRGRGLVNTREHLESLFEAKERGVASLQEYLERSRPRALQG